MSRASLTAAKVGGALLIALLVAMGDDSDSSTDEFGEPKIRRPPAPLPPGEESKPMAAPDRVTMLSFVH